MHPLPSILGPGLVRIRVSDTMRTDALGNSGIGSVILGPVSHVMLARAMHAAWTAKALEPCVCV